MTRVWVSLAAWLLLCAGLVAAHPLDGVDTRTLHPRENAKQVTLALGELRILVRSRNTLLMNASAENEKVLKVTPVGCESKLVFLSGRSEGTTYVTLTDLDGKNELFRVTVKKARQYEIAPEPTSCPE